MPYNTSAIQPPSEASGTTSLPLARVKKIIHADEDIGNCSNNAAFAIAVATEMFIRHLTEQAHNIVKSERKPRRNIQYRDVANAVARIDNLEFLSDVVPRTTTYKAFKEKKAREDATVAENGLPNGQRTLHQMTKPEELDDITMEGQEGGEGAEEQVGEEGNYDDTQDTLEEQEDEQTDPRSPYGGEGSKARHNFDAMRNGHEGNHMDISMED